MKCERRKSNDKQKGIIRYGSGEKDFGLTPNCYNPLLDLAHESPTDQYNLLCGFENKVYPNICSVYIFLGYGNPIGGCHTVVHFNTAFYKVTSVSTS